MDRAPLPEVPRGGTQQEPDPPQGEDFGGAKGYRFWPHVPDAGRQAPADHLVPPLN